MKGNDLADAAAKRVLISFEDIPEHQKVTVTIGKYAERPEFWVMHTDKPPTPPISLATVPTLRNTTTTMVDDPRTRKTMHARIHQTVRPTPPKSPNIIP
jgi:hypothetical protein